MEQQNNLSLLLTDKSAAKELSIEISGTYVVLGIALIAFGFGYTIANSKKKAL